MTLKAIEKLGRNIASNSKNIVNTKGGNTNFEQVVKIGASKVKVRSVLNKNKTLRTVYLKKK